MSIRTRIGLALGIVLVLHLFTAVMGHVGLQKSQQDIAKYELINADTIAVLSLDRTITELQRNVSKFMLTGHDAPAARVRELLEQAAMEIDAGASSSQDPFVREHLAKMSETIATYGRDFEKVAIDRNARERLVYDEMYPTRDAILGALNELSSGDERYREPARAAQEHMLLAEAAALRYLDSPSRSLVEESIGHIRGCRSASQSLPTTSDGNSIPDLVAAYERAFLESVQATRGYLHLVNVVLAGQASELLYDSSQIRTVSLRHREALSSSLQADARRFQRLSDGIAIVTVIAGMILASLMTRSVLKPILALTGTLRSLAAGKPDTEVEGIDRHDEIGAMAQAAEVFRIKNIQTEQLLDESRRMAADLEQRNGEMTQFVYTVSHDLKTPLVTIQGYAEMIQDGLELGDREIVDDSAARIVRASGRMFQTLNDLLELSRVGATESRVTLEPLGELVDAVLADLSPEARQGDIDIRVAPNLPDTWCEATQARQVIQNLVQNSINHGRPEQGKLVIGVDATRRDGATVLSVSDNGPGINPEYAERVFSIFQRLSTTTPGTGVGLAIVRKIAESHGGRAWVETAPGGGAMFFVSFPDIAAQEAAA